MSSPIAPSACQNCPNWQRSSFKCCQSDELERISAGKMCQRYQKGQVIFWEGSRPTGIYCIHQGMVKLMKRGGDGKEQIMRLAHDGDIMGHRSLLSEATAHSVTAVAMNDCVVCHVPRTDFLGLVGNNPQFSQFLLKLLSTTLSETEERMLHLAYKPVRERLAEALLLLQRKFCGRVAKEQSTITVSREELASLVGTAKETVSRLISEFKEEGLITAKGSHITILAVTKLEALATFYD